MGPLSMAVSLRSRNVQLRVRNGQPEWHGQVTPPERAAIHANRPAFAAAIELIEAGGSVDDDRAARARAFWIAKIGREAGVDTQALFDRIDARFGHRVAGPFELTPDEAVTLAIELRAEFGTRAAIVPATRTVAAYALPASIVLKNQLGWTDEKFSAFCRRTIKKVGITSAEDDRRVLAAMPEAPQ